MDSVTSAGNSCSVPFVKQAAAHRHYTSLPARSASPSPSRPAWRCRQVDRLSGSPFVSIVTCRAPYGRSAAAAAAAERPSLGRVWRRYIRPIGQRGRPCPGACGPQGHRLPNRDHPYRQTVMARRLQNRCRRPGSVGFSTHRMEVIQHQTLLLRQAMSLDVGKYR